MDPGHLNPILFSLVHFRESATIFSSSVMFYNSVAPYIPRFRANCWLPIAVGKCAYGYHPWHEQVTLIYQCHLARNLEGCCWHHSTPAIFGPSLWTCSTFCICNQHVALLWKFVYFTTVRRDHPGSTQYARTCWCFVGHELPMCSATQGSL